MLSSAQNTSRSKRGKTSTPKVQGVKETSPLLPKTTRKIEDQAIAESSTIKGRERAINVMMKELEAVDHREETGMTSPRPDEKDAGLEKKIGGERDEENEEDAEEDESVEEGCIEEEYQGQKSEESGEEDNYVEEDESMDEDDSERDEEEGSESESEDEGVQEVIRSGPLLLSRPSTPLLLKHDLERHVATEKRKHSQAVVNPSPEVFKDYQAIDGSMNTVPLHTFSDLSLRTVSKIYGLLHDEDNPRPIQSICFGLTCHDNWKLFRTQWCIPISDYEIYANYLPPSDQSLLMPLLQNWVPNKYRMMSGLGGIGGPSFIPMFLSKKEYGEKGYTREEERLEKRYDACFSILDATNLNGEKLMPSRGLHGPIDNTIDLPNPYNMGHQ